MEMVTVSLESWNNFEIVAAKTVKFIKNLKDKNNQLQKENKRLKQKIKDLEIISNYEKKLTYKPIIHKSFNNHGGAICWRKKAFNEVHNCWWSMDWRNVTCPDCKALR